MIFALAGQFKQLCHICTWKCSSVLNRIQTYDLGNTSSLLLPTQLLYEATLISSGQIVGLMCCLSWSSHMLDNSSNTWTQQIDLLWSEWFHSCLGESTEPQSSWVRISLRHLKRFRLHIWGNCLNCCKCKDHFFDSISSFPQVSPTISTTCDIIFQDKVNANMNMTYGSSTVSFEVFLFLNLWLQNSLQLWGKELPKTPKLCYSKIHTFQLDIPRNQ